MKKMIVMVFMSTMCSFGFAQKADKPAVSKSEQVIQNIPSLSVIKNKITKHGLKTEGRKELYKNSDADLKALKTKYQAELTNQINNPKYDRETIVILKEELEKTNKEIKNLN